MIGADDPSVSPENYIDTMFGAGGLLAQGKADYRPREGQIRYARAVDRAIAERRHLLAEGPVGVGKSFGYSVPATYWASRSHQTIVIVTANIALQEQIFEKDLPLLRAIAPWEFSFALMKGRNNFLCLNAQREHDVDIAAKRWSPDRLDPNGKRHLKMVEQWADDARRNPLESEGDKSELPVEPPNEIWRRFSATADECLGDNCTFFDECFSNRAFRTARESQVIVTNYHMLFAHLKVYQDTGLDLVLPSFDIAILDEVHKAADIARDFFGIQPITEEAIKRGIHKTARAIAQARARLTELGGNRARANARFDAGEISRDLEDDIGGRASRLFHALAAYKNDERRYKGHLSGRYSMAEIDRWNELKEKLYLANTVAERSKNLLEATLLPPLDADEPLRADPQLSVLVTKAAKAANRIGQIVSDLSGAMDPTSNPKQVFYLDENEKKIISVRSKLVYASDALRPALFHKHGGRRDEEGKIVRGPDETTVIGTSATITIKGDDFRYIANELGCDDYSTVLVESPFDWTKQALLISPLTVTSPTAKHHEGLSFHDSVAEHIERIVLLSGGRALCLFTSNKSLNTTYNRIAGPCGRQGIRVLRQGDLPRTKLIEEFKKDVRSVLLGVESFWAGVDVPGEACSVVTIDRLPFPNPDDPVLSVLAAAHEFKKVFFKYSVPRAIIQVQQGAGRLIRSVTDRGVLVILDRRLIDQKHGYGGDFRRSLPKMPWTTDLNAIPEWLAPPAAPAWDAL